MNLHSYQNNSSYCSKIEFTQRLSEVQEAIKTTVELLSEAYPSEEGISIIQKLNNKALEALTKCQSIEDLNNFLFEDQVQGSRCYKTLFHRAICQLNDITPMSIDLEEKIKKQRYKIFVFLQSKL